MAVRGVMAGEDGAEHLHRDHCAGGDKPPEGLDPLLLMEDKHQRDTRFQIQRGSEISLDPTCSGGMNRVPELTYTGFALIVATVTRWRWSILRHMDRPPLHEPSTRRTLKANTRCAIVVEIMLKLKTRETPTVRCTEQSRGTSDIDFFRHEYTLDSRADPIIRDRCDPYDDVHDDRDSRFWTSTGP